MTQNLESKKMHTKIADKKLSRALAALQLKSFCFNDNTIKLIVNSATVQNAVKIIL